MTYTFSTLLLALMFCSWHLRLAFVVLSMGFAMGTALAQADTTAYLITLNNGQQFVARNLEANKGKYIRGIKEDSTAFSLGWDVFKEYKKYVQPPAKRSRADILQQKERERLEKAKAEQKDWPACFVVFPAGDTLRGKVNLRRLHLTGEDADTIKDFSVGPALLQHFTFSHNDGQTEIIYANEFLQLYIPSAANGYKQYISMLDSTHNEIYRVVEDGVCKLLAQKKIFTKDPHSYYYDEDAKNGPSLIDVYYVTCKGEWMKIPAENIARILSLQYTDFFDELSADNTGADDKHYTEQELRRIIQHLNKCFGPKVETPNTPINQQRY